MIIYLAGGFRGGVGERIQKEIKSWSFSDSILVFDPKSWNSENASAEQYTAMDLDHIKKCDLVVAFMSSKNPSGYGLCVEVGYAHGLGKPVFFLDNIDDWRSRYFDMIRVMSNFVTKDVSILLSKIYEISRPHSGGQ